MLSKTQVLLFFLLATVLTLVNIYWLSKEVDLSQPVPSQTNNAEWFARDLISTVMDDQGKPKQRIQGEYLIHYDNQQQTLLQTLRGVVYNAGEFPWFFRAKQGTAFHQTSFEDVTQLDLQGDVVFWQIAADTQTTTKMETQSLTYFPSEELAITDAWVIFSHGRQRTTAEGMRAFLAEERVELLSQVSGEHEFSQS